MSSPWPPTARVVLQGLSREELNGLEAVVLHPAQDRYAVKITSSGESIRVKPQNLAPAPALMESLSADELLACFLRLPPASAARARLVSTTWRAAITAMLRMPAWQAKTLPLAALCRAGAWAGVLQRLAAKPHEVDWSLQKVLDRDGFSSFPPGDSSEGDPDPEFALLHEPDTKENGLQHYFVDDERRESPLALAVRGGAPPEVLRALLDACPKASEKRAVGTEMEMELEAQGCDPEECATPCPDCAWERCKLVLVGDDGKCSVCFEDDGQLWEGLPPQKIRHVVHPSRLHAAVQAGRGPDVLAVLLEDAVACRVAATAAPLLPPRPGERTPVLDPSPTTVEAAAREATPLLRQSLLDELDELGLAPIHHASIRRDPHAIRWALEVWPAAARQETGKEFHHMPGCLPLHLLARGPGIEPKRLRPPPAVSEDEAAAAVELLLAAAPDVATLPVPKSRDYGEGSLPLHLAANFGAPAAVLERLLAAHPEAASVAAPCGLPCHLLAGRNLTPAMQGEPLDCLLAAHPPTPEWALRDLLALGVAAEEPTLARLAAHPHEASEQDPFSHPSYSDPNSREHQALKRLGKLGCRRYPLHHAAGHAASAAVVSRLIELCPEAVCVRDSRGNFPIHIAATTAGKCTKGTWGGMRLREPPAAEVVDAAAACCTLLLRAWPEGGRACDDFVPEADTSECRFGEQDRDCGWWPLHLALHAHAPEKVLDALRPHTPCDAFGNPKRKLPGRKWCVKSNGHDMRRLGGLRKNQVRSGQLRYLCAGAEGAPEQLKWHEYPRGYDSSGLRVSTQVVWHLKAVGPPEACDPSLDFVPYDDWPEGEEHEDGPYSDDEDDE